MTHLQDRGRGLETALRERNVDNLTVLELLPEITSISRIISQTEEGEAWVGGLVTASSRTSTCPWFSTLQSSYLQLSPQTPARVAACCLSGHIRT